MRARSSLTEQALLLSVLIGSAQITWGSLAPVLPLFADDFGTTVAILGPAIAAFGLGRAIISIPAGVLLRWWRPRPYLYASVGALVISTALTALVTTPTELVVARVIAGVCGGAVITIAFAVLIAGAPAAKRGTVMATATVVQLSAAALGSLLGGITADAWGLRAVFLVAVVPVLGALTWDLWRPARHYWAVASGRRAVDPAAPGASSPPEPSASGRAPRRGVALVIAALALVSFAAFFARFAGEQGLLPTLGYDLAGVSPTTLGTMLAAGTVVSIAALIPVSRAVNKGARLAIFIPASALTVGALMAFPLASDAWVFAGLIAVYTSASSVAGMIPSVVTADRVPAHLTGTAVGVTRTAGDVGAVVGPLAVFGVYGLAGAWWALGVIAAVVAAAAAIFAPVARRRARAATLRQEQAEPPLAAPAKVSA